MSLDKQKSLSAMRTFARDLDRERGGEEENTQPVADKDTKSPKTVVIEKTKDEKESAFKKGEDIVVSKKTDKKKQPKKIPAFHELQKNKKVAKPKVSKKDKKGITTDKPMGGGTIITDTKKEKRSFFADLSDSLTHWFADVKKSFKPKKKNTYSVSTTERRKGVVQKATSKSGTIFSADNETLKEQIKERQRAERKKDADEDELLWSPYTETGYPLLEDGEAESVDPRVKSVSVTFTKKSKPEPVKETVEKKPEPVVKKFVEPEPVTIPEPEKITEPATPEKVTAAPPEEIIPDEPEVSEEVFIEEESINDEFIEDDEDVPTRTFSEAVKTDTNTQTLVLVGIVIALIIAAFAIYTAVGVFTNSDNSTEETQRIEQFFPQAAQKTISLTEATFNELSQRTNTTFIQNQDLGLIEYAYTQGNGTELLVTTLLSIIDAQTEESFLQSIDGVRFVQTAENDRAIVLKVDDTINALGGMLAWEATMYADIGGLLGTSNVSPNAGIFTDTQFGSADVRVLLFDDDTLLLYSFINETYVVIANDISVLIPLSQ